MGIHVKKTLTVAAWIVSVGLTAMTNLADAQSLPFQGTTTTSNGDNSAFKVVNNTNVLGTTTTFRAEGSNATGGNTAFYGRGGSIGADFGTAAASGVGLATNCTGASCLAIYSIVPTGFGGANSFAGWFSSERQTLYTTASTSAGIALQANADVFGATAAKISSANGTALNVTSGAGRAGYFYASSGTNSTVTVEQTGSQAALAAISFNNSSGDALYAQATSGDGVEARCTGASCQNGVYGFSSNPGASCVIGQSTAGVQGYGVVGRSYGAGYAVYGDLQSGTSGYAAYFNGRTHVNGTLSKLSGTFKIDHPLDPANKFLVHSFVESPDMKNIYDGVTTLGPDGTATVRLPAYFESLNENFRYQLTPIGGQASLYVKTEIQGGAFVVAGGSAGLRVSWQVTGSRKDAWAKANPVVPEQEKSPKEKGRFLTPELFGPQARAIVDGPALAVPGAELKQGPAPDFSRPLNPQTGVE